MIDAVKKTHSVEARVDQFQFGMRRLVRVIQNKSFPSEHPCPPIDTLLPGYFNHQSIPNSERSGGDGCNR
jgi:hypothetical protein